MNRNERRQAAAFANRMGHDLARARDGLGTLADIVEAGRDMGRDVSSQEIRLAELVAVVGRLSAEVETIRELAR